MNSQTALSSETHLAQVQYLAEHINTE